MEHNKGQLLNLTKMTGLKRVAHDGWLRGNLFDAVKESWQVLHMESPKFIQCYFKGVPFMFQRTRGKFSKKRAEARAAHINSLTLTARAFLIGGRQGE